MKKRVELVQQAKTNRPCQICGNTFPFCAMDYHHTDKSTKVDTVSHMIHRSRYSIADLLAEIGKCILVCACCHRILHQEELDGDEA